MSRIIKAVVRPVSLASSVTSQLEKLIVESRFQPGQRLPAERDLADQFGVSRTVIREAVRSLTAKGMVEVKAGSGSRVKTPSAQNLASSMTLFLRNGRPELDHKKVTEVRRLLEVEIAGLAAERRTGADLELMQEILEESDEIHVNRERFVEWDISFHSALASATGNELFLLLLGSVVGTMRTVREVGFNIPSTPNQAIKHHRAIFAQVKKGSATGARNAMREHLIEAEATLRRALDLRSNRPS